MGNQREYVESGGFSQYLYVHNDGDIIREGNLEAKVVFKAGTKDYHESLPQYSNISKMYFGLGKDSVTGKKRIDQLRVYKDRIAYMDFDWGHTHIVRENGRVVRTYPTGTVHVQFWKIVNGKPVRDRKRTRMMNNFEIKKYGAFLRKANPNIKFR